MEDNTKCYKVVCWCSSKVNYYVYANNKEEAKQLVEQGEYTDKEVIDENIEDITYCIEEED